MRRARSAAASAHLVLDVYDARVSGGPTPTEDPGRLVVATRADRVDVAEGAAPPPGVALVSPVTGEGIAELRREIARRLRAPGSRPVESVALATERHRAAALAAREALGRARAGLERGIEPELAAVEVREAVASLRSILGEVAPDDILGTIFARFCIGK
jgi:tRNA modification GTPase